jgi:hypothetical protein
MILRQGVQVVCGTPGRIYGTETHSTRANGSVSPTKRWHVTGEATTRESFPLRFFHLLSACSLIRRDQTSGAFGCARQAPRAGVGG